VPDIVGVESQQLQSLGHQLGGTGVVAATRVQVPLVQANIPGHALQLTRRQLRRIGDPSGIEQEAVPTLAYLGKIGTGVVCELSHGASPCASHSRTNQS